LRQPGDERLLPEIELGDVLVEVFARGRLHAEGAVTEEDVVQVERQDLALRIGRLEAAREDQLLDLARPAALRRGERLGHLLRDGRAALLDAAGAQVGGDRAHQAAQVEAAVREEAAIFCRQEGVDQRRRHVIERHDLAALGRQLGEQRAVLRPQRGHAGRRRRVGRQIGSRRQLLAEVQVDADADEAQRRHRRDAGKHVELDEPIEEAAVRRIGDGYALHAGSGWARTGSKV
jgi:hypothetical protein